MTLRTSRRRSVGLLAFLLAFGLVAAACGGGDDEGGGGGATQPGQTSDGGGGEEGTPTPGGKVVYALEADSTGGYCLPEAQLAISGMQVARSVYDTLTVPNADGDYVPFLAKSVEPNDAYDVWTIKLRKGIKFHDGSDLTAEVVKNNLDAYRGAYEGRSPLLFLFVFQNIDSVEATGPLTVKVKTKTPWPALPAYLYGSARIGIIAQAQLDDTKTCDRRLIGTGPFLQKKVADWKVNDKFTLYRNPDYWQKDADGNQLPYLDELEYRPQESAPERLNGFKSSTYSAMMTSESDSIIELRDMAESGDANTEESNAFGEVGYTMLNASKAPFDNINARKALAYGIDRSAVNEARNSGILENASGPFAPGNDGYLEDTGYPEYDKAEAEKYVEAYKDDTGDDLKFTLTHSGDADTTATAQLLQQLAGEIGVDVTLTSVADQSSLINEAIAGNFQAMLWRNHPGGDPDTQYVWWQSKSPVNFGRIPDKKIDQYLENGRTETDPEKRTEIYEKLNKRFADQVWNLWGQWTLWTVATAPNIHGIMGPPLPDGSDPFPGLATGHPVTTLWIEQ